MPEDIVRDLMTKDKCHLAFIRQALEQTHIEEDDPLADIAGIGNRRAGEITVERMVDKFRIAFDDEAYHLVQIILGFTGSIDLLLVKFLLDTLPPLIVDFHIVLSIGRWQSIELILVLQLVLIQEIGQKSGIFRDGSEFFFLCPGRETANHAPQKGEKGKKPGITVQGRGIGSHNAL
jgi:hypothetical protein